MQDVPPWSDSYWEVNRSPENSPVSADARRPDSQTAFLQFVDNLLNVTLVIPQTLLLALHYVCRACRADPKAIYKAFSYRSAPYKLLLGALVMANKVLGMSLHLFCTFVTHFINR